MKWAVAIILGLFSGLLVFSAVASTVAQMELIPRLFIGLGALVVAWFTTAKWLVVTSATVAAVFRRGFLLGAAEWLLLIPVNILVISLKTNNAMAAGLGGLMVAVIDVGMSILCLICFTIAYFAGKEGNGVITVQPTQ